MDSKSEAVGSVLDVGDSLAKVQTLGDRVGGPEKSKQASSKICGLGDIRLGVRVVSTQQKHGRGGRKGGEELRVRRAKMRGGGARGKSNPKARSKDSPQSTRGFAGKARSKAPWNGGGQRQRQKQHSNAEGAEERRGKGEGKQSVARFLHAPLCSL